MWLIARSHTPDQNPASLLEVAAAPYGLGFWLLPAAPGWALARGGTAAVLQPPASPRGAPTAPKKGPSPSKNCGFSLWVLNVAMDNHPF